MEKGDNTAHRAGPGLSTSHALHTIPPRHTAPLQLVRLLQSSNSLTHVSLPRVVEQAKNRMRLVPYTALQQTKPGAKFVPPRCGSPRWQQCPWPYQRPRTASHPHQQHR